ncbi:MAG: rhodanese-like domain-containing protein [Congregibacter sp.]|nr:rhodanese-like domain-containing protein [Congregibacter sp.]
MKSAQDLVTAAKAAITEISLDDAESALSTIDVLIDVREANEFLDGHIKDSINIPRGLLEFSLSTNESLQDRSRQILVYCKSSGRAALAAQTMQNMGYRHVRSISGGFDAWKDAGKPVVYSPKPDFG